LISRRGRPMAQLSPPGRMDHLDLASPQGSSGQRSGSAEGRA